MAKSRLVVVLGDQLDLESSLLRRMDRDQDQIWMAEVQSESTHVWSHQARIVLFLSAMRHFREALLKKGFRVHYRELDEGPKVLSLGEALKKDLNSGRFSEVWITEPGEHRVREEIEGACRGARTPVVIFPDESFLISHEEFKNYSKSRSGLRMEFFYRMMRKRCAVLMNSDGETPVGGKWNFDTENRGAFGRRGPEGPIEHLGFSPDKVTLEVIRLVKERFKYHPGSLDRFDWPVNRSQALKTLEYFIDNHLVNFGLRQDAMWQGEPFLHHSRLSVALNLKLLRPLEVIQRAETAYREKRATLESVEGFIRQILGWREYVRGVYYLLMPEYLNRNGLKAHEKLPEFFWTGDVQMNCLRQTIGQTLEWGYAHHIQRLMVTGLYCLLLGVDPREVHQWYLAVYVDAVEWVELPNTLGMSQYADGGVMASKPYIASGKYIQRMSNYCQSCPFDPAEATGPKACPFTTLYWDFVARHEALLKKNPRLSMQAKNWARIPESRKAEIRELASRIRRKGGSV